MIDVSKLLYEGGGLHKYNGVAPEGFVLVHEKTLEDLKEYKTWWMWTQNEISINDLDKENFKKYK
jgi:hypothetical protein